MATRAARHSKVRFGVYVLDASNGELHKGQVRLRLHPQPFRVLCMLVERAGAVVTREEIRDTLWDSDTFVEFERSINFCISQIRSALSDDAENPRYIETLPKRGYRFVAQVTTPIPVMPEANLSLEDARPKRVPGWTLASAVALLILAAALLAWLSFMPAPPSVLSAQAITHDAKAKGTYASVATDGARVYFQESAASRSFIAQVAASGGETSEIPIAVPVPTIYELSPNGSNLLLGSVGLNGYDLWIQPLPSGSLRRVGEIHASDGGWFPDGDHIVFVDGESISISKADGGGIRTIVKTGGAPAWPRVSPDGRRVRFTVFDLKESSSKLWEVSPEGTDLHELLPGWNSPPNECCGNWTVDGKYYVFQSERDGSTNLWAVREQGFRRGRGVPIQLTDGPLNYYAPKPRPDGKQLFAIGQQNRSELVRYNTKSGAFEPYLDGISATQVHISPDGLWAAYVSYPEGTVWRSAVDGSLRRQLTSPPFRAMWPRWSPDGKRISFTAFSSGSPPTVYIVPAEGGNLTRIGPEFALGFSWSPNGKSAVFNTLAPPVGTAAPGPAHIQRLEFDTQRMTPLLGSEGLVLPEWSPDGKYILAKSGDDHRVMLFTIPAQKWSELARGDVISNLRWSRDGAFIYFERTSAQDSVLMRLRLKDRKLEQVLDFRGIRRPLIMLSSAWSGLADDGSPLFQRDLGTQEIYVLDCRLP